jgi:BASS family bile acid:Na+ symporter
MTLATLIPLVIKISIMLSVFAIGLKATFSDAIYLFRKPGLALGAFALVGVIAGHILGGPDPENRPVLALATSTRHPAVALAISHVNFPNQKLAGALVLVYLVLSTILAAPYLNWTKHSRSTSTAGEKHVEA